MTTDPIGWAASLRPGTVLSFRFPLGEGEGRAKTRPCLVIATTLREGERFITIAYGTSAGSRSNRGLDLDLSDRSEWEAAGLRRRSRFVLMRRVTVPATDAGFNLRNGGTPVIGLLPRSAMVTLHKLVGLLGNGIAEDRRGGSAGARLTKRQPQHGICWQRRRGGRLAQVAVEHRRRRRVPATGLRQAGARLQGHQHVRADG
ncbi:hypothetical protein [Paracoccus luteus]|uniref:hypothetical protein n=1 Tax=Paracoccus luteus TaxID=2508543 RepID=UPI00106F5698|nr:hypothetical protein [Paracoccus luteus]